MDYAKSRDCTPDTLQAMEQRKATRTAADECPKQAIVWTQSQLPIQPLTTSLPLHRTHL